jgi:hypothetical protein
MIRGTSNDVIGQIASTCGVDYLGTKTSDGQVWIQKNRKYNEYASAIADHGYIDGQSCMHLGYDIDNKLIYSNIVEKKNPTAVFLTSKYTQNTYTVTDFQVLNRSGLMNTISGYAEAIRDQSIFSTTSTLTDEVDVVRQTQKLMLHSDVYDAVTQSRVFFRPINAGNVHSNYQIAKYQNKRIANLYSLNVEVVVSQPTENVRLLDNVVYESKMQDGRNTAYSGNYIVTSRVIYIQGFNYNEKFELTRQGLNIAANSQK